MLSDIARSVCFVAVMGLAVSASAAQALKIMPLGDSITQGGTTQVGGAYVGYRYDLYYKLKAAGLDVDFVGTRTAVHNGTPSATLYPNYSTTFDRDNQGEWGRNTTYLRDNISTWLASTGAPDVVLLHIGTNDLRGPSYADVTAEQTAAQAAANRVGEIIGRLRAVNSKVKVFVAQIISYTPTSVAQQMGLEAVGYYNQDIVTLAAQLSTEQSPVIAVDHYSGFNPVTMTYDNLHPNALGEAHMSDAWYDAMASAGVVPEPGTFTLVGLGAWAALGCRRRSH